MFTWFKNILSFLRSRVLLEFILFSGFAAVAWGVLIRFMDAAQAFFLYNFIEKGLLAAFKKHMDRIDKEKAKKELQEALINKEREVYLEFYVERIISIIDAYRQSNITISKTLLIDLLNSLDRVFSNPCISEYTEIQNLKTALMDLDIKSDDFLKSIEDLRDKIKVVITTNAFNCKSKGENNG